MRTKHPVRLWIAFAVLSLAVFTINVSLWTSPPKVTGFASANATVQLCINSPPSVNISGCNSTAFVGTPYTCTVVATDTQQLILDYDVLLISGPAIGNSLFYMTGNNLSFTANISHIGNYTLRFSVDDLSNCGDYSTTTLFNLSVNSSDNSPYLVQPLPNRTWDANTLLLAFDLDDYFADPNNDPLSYSVYGNSNVGVSITAGEVLLTPATNWCGTETILFRATDPTNLSADSNLVTLTVNCPSSSSSGSASSGGGGGGGGGGSASDADRNRCVPQYSCFEWSSCQLTRAVSLVDGESQTIEVTGVRGTRKYVIDENASLDPNVYYEGFSYKDCVDTRVCENARTLTYIRQCEYHPSCEDGLQNQGETGVDCGGPCAPCGTCNDGIQNNGEVAIDCGGPVCPACNSCSNSKLDGFELGVDCGGPDCDACATCLDGIKNQDETGIDCGGQWCDACSDIQFPSLKASLPWLTLFLLLLITILTLFIFFAAIKRRFVSLFLAYLFKHKKTNRVILLPTDIKADIIRRLAELEKVIEKQPILKSQEELARIIRDYFKASLHLEFEFTYEELVEAISKSKLNALLGGILQHFFRRISILEFSGVAIAPIVLRALIQETRELVYQTSVLTMDDLKERDSDLTLRDIPPDTPAVDRAYLLLSQIHLCLQFRKLEVAAAVYQVLLEWYSKAPSAEQHVIFDDFNRVYDEYCLASGSKQVKPH